MTVIMLLKKVLDALMCRERDEDALDHLLWQQSGIKLYIQYMHIL